MKKSIAKLFLLAIVAATVASCAAGRGGGGRCPAYDTPNPNAQTK